MSTEVPAAQSTVDSGQLRWSLVEAFGLDEKMTVAHQVDYVWHQLKLQDQRTSELEDACNELGTFVTSTSTRTCLHEYDCSCSSFDLVLYVFPDGSAIALPQIWSSERPPLVFPDLAKRMDCRIDKAKKA